MAKVYLLEDSPQELSYGFFCPGCQCSHFFRTRRSDVKDALWTWNEDYEKPTVKPSIDVCRSIPHLHCHFFITDGMIKYQNDCHHNLRGTNVPMEEDD